ncbi:Glycosyl transferase family 2 [Methylobacterium sp. 174MFSha1.1]|uniref:glycosyltransferase n=1 Tax=Methylobacterium sp. 174MFSha1.1 TaxID=1502749 RepID=UPI0008E54422|nr:glycosyltransferase family A protein [Methylobacterium sp. 174MFSha1.1]SFV16217.1 Glycosyl transferase family 2 [Methylobacterium sp. 174MFSha1.1]
MPKSQPRYALVTAARNEAYYIHRTLESVVKQSLPPKRWVIVSDNSTDDTDAIIENFRFEHDFIVLVRNNTTSARNTAAKVEALKLALSTLSEFDYEYVGVIDADVSFGPTYFEELLSFFDTNPEYGIIGGKILDVFPGQKPVNVKSDDESVPGAIQFFRRECFERIGGYLPIAGGMEDGVAEISARYHGWKTASLQHLPVYHHKPEGLTGRPVLRTRFNSGTTEYIVGFSPIYNVARALSRLLERPVFLGSVMILIGYAWGAVSRKPRAISPELIRFMRREQYKRLLRRLVKTP